jgi:hypothetical protein
MKMKESLHKIAAKTRILSFTRLSCFSKLRRDDKEDLTEVIFFVYILEKNFQSIFSLVN